MPSMSMRHMPAQLILDLAESARCGEEHQLAEVGDTPVLEREKARGEAEERRLDNLYNTPDRVYRMIADSHAVITRAIRETLRRASKLEKTSVATWADPSASAFV